MKISIITIIQWVAEHWNEINKIVKLITDTVLEVEKTPTTGAAKRHLVFEEIVEILPRLNEQKSLLNTVIELVVAILKWKGKI